MSVLELVSSDTPKDVVFGKIKVFGNILCFVRVNWVQKWTKSENFGYVPFPFKDISFKSSSYNVFVS